MNDEAYPPNEHDPLRARAVNLNHNRPQEVSEHMKHNTLSAHPEQGKNEFEGAALLDEVTATINR